MRYESAFVAALLLFLPRIQKLDDLLLHLFGRITAGKILSQGEFSYEKAFDVMGQEKKSEKDTVTIKNETLRKYFPRSYTPKQMEEKIIQLLDAWQKKQQRRNER